MVIAGRSPGLRFDIKQKGPERLAEGRERKGESSGSGPSAYAFEGNGKKRGSEQYAPDYIDI